MAVWYWREPQFRHVPLSSLREHIYAARNRSCCVQWRSRAEHVQEVPDLITQVTFFYTHFHTFSPKPRGDTLRKVECFWIKVLWSSVSPAARTQHQLSANLNERPAAFLPPPTSFKKSAWVNLEIREGLRCRHHHTTRNFVALGKVSRHNEEKEACSCSVMCHSMSSKQKHWNVQGEKKTETKLFS